jgi:heat shock protein HtpX
MMWLRRIGLFLLVNFCVMATVGLILWLFDAQTWLSHQGLNIPALLVSCLVWGMTGSVISLLLSKQMAKWTMGLQMLDRQRASGAEAELLRLVDELAQRASLKALPEVGIYRSAELNAFATGPSETRALVAVSTGLLRSLSREELEAVLGHEISHIKNGDMITMTLLQGVMNAFVLFLSRILAYALVMGRRSENTDARGGSYAAFGAVSFLLQMVFMVLASMVIAGYSRWREYRADAGGARLAGVSSMISALRALERGSKIEDPTHSPPALAALKIAGAPWHFGDLFSTHPPLQARINRLQSEF